MKITNPYRKHARMSYDRLRNYKKTDPRHKKESINYINIKIQSHEWRIEQLKKEREGLNEN